MCVGVLEEPQDAECDDCWQEFVKKQSSKEQPSQRKLKKKPRGKASENSSLCHNLTPEKKVRMRSAMEDKYPNVQFILDALAKILAVLSAEGDLLLEDARFELFKTRKWAMVSPINSVVQRSIKQKRTLSPTLFCV